MRGQKIILLSAVMLGSTACGSRSSKPGQPDPALIAKGEQAFQAKCISCHTVGQGKRIGPDLKDVHQRRDRAWLVKWIKDPVGMAASDPIGQKIFAEWNKAPMPPLNLSDAEIDGVLAYVEAASAKAPAAPPPPAEVKLSDADFAKGKDLYFNRCAGCHGTLRTGATGPTLEPKRTKEIGTEGLKVILQNGTPGGMPPFGRQGILTAEEIEVMAGFLQLPPPTPPQLPIEKAKESWKLVVPVAERPTKPDTKRDWQDYFGVVFRDAGQVGIFDGKSKELVGVIDTGFAVHILRSSSTGRYFYAVGRDGRVTMIDLWPEKPTLVAQVQGCYDARSVDSSKYKGFEDKLLIEGCYWPPQYVVMDGQTLEPLKITDVTTPAVDTNEPLTEVRVASIIASHFDPLWVVSLKEAGYVALVDYSKPDFPIVSKIPADRFLHDGGWDHSKRYFMVAANMRNKMAIVDVKDKKLVTTFETGIKPHPGRGANWRDPKFGWVNGTTHIGEGKLVVYGADPVKKPEHAWKVVRELKLPSAGGLFVKTHEKSPWVWIDMPLSNDATAMRNVCVYSKAKGDIEKCWTPSDRGRALHFEYNKDGSEVWLSTWDKSGELIVYDDKTLAEKTRIKGDYMVTPTGKFNVYNTAHDVY